MQIEVCACRENRKRFSLRLYPYQDGVAAFLADVTDAHSMTERIRLSESSLAQAQRIGAIGSWEIRIDRSRPSSEWQRSWSDETSRIHGLAPGTARAADDFDALIHPDDLPRVAAARHALAERGEPMSLDYRIRRANGVEAHLHIEGEATADAEGNVLRLAGTVQDISERKHKELELGLALSRARRSEDEVDRAQAIARFGSWAIDVDPSRPSSQWERRWSPEIFRIYGLDRTSIPDQDAVANSIHPEDRERVLIARDAMFATGTDVSIDFRVIKPDGTLVHVHSQGKAVRDAQGEIVALAGSLQDISARKLNELELQRALDRAERSEESLAHAQSIGHIGSWEADAVPGRPMNEWPRRWSEETFRLFGVSGSLVPALDDVEKRIHPDDLGAVLRARETLIRDGVPMSIDHRVLHDDGHIVHVHAEGTAIHDAGGNLVGLAGTIQDISQRKRAESALDQSRRELEGALTRLRTLIDTSPDLIIVTTADTRITEVSSAVVTLLGYQAAEAIGRRLTDFIHPGDLQRAVPCLGDVLRGTPMANWEARLLHKCGDTVHTTWSAVWSAQGNCAIGIGRDVSAAKRRERLELARRQTLEAIAISRPINEVLDAIVLAVEEQFPGATASILREHGERGVRLVCGPNLNSGYRDALGSLEIGPRAASCGTALYRNEAVICTDVRDDELWAEFRDIARNCGIGACWSFPIGGASQAASGTFAISFPEPRTPSADDVSIMRGAANLAELAFDRVADRDRIERERQRFRSMFDYHPHVVFAIDLQASIIDCNAQAVTWSRVSREQLVGRALSSLVSADSREEFTLVLARVTRGRVQAFDCVAISAGEERVVSFVLLPTIVGERPDGAFAVMQDVTVLRRADQQLQDALTRSRLLSGRMLALNRASVASGGAQDVSELSRVMVDELRETIGAHLAVFAVNLAGEWRHATRAISLSSKYAAWSADAQNPAPLTGAGIYAVVAETRRPLRLTQQQLLTHDRWRGFSDHAHRHPPLQGLLVVPMIGRDDQCIGALMVSDKSNGTDFDEDDEIVSVRYAQMAGVMLERAALIDELRKTHRVLSERDGFFQLSHELFLIVDRERMIVQVNPAVTWILGFSPAELVGRNILSGLRGKVWVISGEMRVRHRGKCSY